MDTYRPSNCQTLLWIRIVLPSNREDARGHFLRRHLHQNMIRMMALALSKLGRLDLLRENLLYPPSMRAYSLQNGSIPCRLPPLALMFQAAQDQVSGKCYRWAPMEQVLRWQRKM